VVAVRRDEKRKRSNLQMGELFGDVQDAHVLDLLEDRDNESLGSVHCHTDVVIAVESHLCAVAVYCGVDHRVLQECQ
jgi:hypothetical protein